YAMQLLEGETLRSFGQRIWSPYRPSASHPQAFESLTATEPLDGSIFDRRIDDAPRPVERDDGTPLMAAAGQLATTLRIARRLCATLAFLHGEGFVNCDLKPENVLLGKDWPVIIDFGLTMRHPGSRSREAIESQRTLAGTLPYISPE